MEDKEFDQRQLELILRFIKQYEDNSVSLYSLIQNLQALVEYLRTIDNELKKDLRSDIGNIDIVNAIVIEDKRPTSKEEETIINEYLVKIKNTTSQILKNNFMHNDATESLLKDLQEKIPEFNQNIKTHLDYYDEILLHVLFGDFTRFTIDAYHKIDSNDLFLRCMAFVENMMNSKEWSELASVSFLENLHQADDDQTMIKQYLGPKSRKQLEIIEQS